ncbi:hypothetical protein Pcinc_002839 [Petrolisthes cinctipes]|uniref:Uncharacterized protein n=1 Tax=Petrolisthes cinctipes TaxID=88211 RepID=A0AAE1GPI3_PETCI|nr:hypothetical protein Pcinc_002839 [Petrolisthes cinctipes]
MESKEVKALCEAITVLTTQSSSLAARCDAIEVRFGDLTNCHSNTELKITTLVEGQQAMIATVTYLAERLDTIVSRLENMGGESVTPPSPPDHSHSRFTTSFAPSSRRVKAKHR